MMSVLNTSLFADLYIDQLEFGVSFFFNDGMPLNVPGVGRYR